MEAPRLPPAVLAAATDRHGGALEVAATALDGLLEVAGDRDLLEQLDRGPKPVRSLVAPEGRAGLVRRLRALESRGLIALEWTLSAAGAGPRYERRVGLTSEGRDAAVALAAGRRPDGRPLGPRQVAALGELLDGLQIMRLM